MNNTTSQFTGFLTASISKNNPLQTILELTLTDFSPNANNQGIPKTEAENVIRSALNMPIKMYFDGTLKGHTSAYPIGTISEVWLEDETIKARSIIWREEFQKEDEYLRKETAEGRQVGTSWEVYYKDSIQDDSIQWLNGCVFAATCIVSNPAYGDRTLITSVAEETEKAQMDEETENKINSLYAEMDALINFIYEAYCKLICQVEESAEQKNAQNALTRLSEMLGMMDTMEASIKEKDSTIAARDKELSEINEKIVKDHVFSERAKEVSQFIPVDTSQYTMLTSLDENAFQFMVNGLRQSAANTHTTKIPLSIGTPDKLTMAELAKNIRENK